MLDTQTITARLNASSVGRAAVFFDRDGVINEEVGYLHSPDGFIWRDGAQECIKAVNDAHILAIVVTNQGGIARGMYTEHDVRSLHLWLQNQLTNVGAHIDAFYFCPHHEEGCIPHLSFPCQSRKPMPGMLLQAAQQWSIDLTHSIMLGDKPRDMGAADNAGVMGITVDRYTLRELSTLLSSQSS